MNGLYQWVGSILCFLIFVTMVQNLLPSKSYEKYIRFFVGMVLILLVMQPFLGGLRLEDRIACYFEAISFQNDARDLSREILGIEKQRLLQVIDAYEQAVERDVAVMAEDAGFAVEAVQAEIDSDQDSEWYGMVTGIMLVVREAGQGSGEQDDAGLTASVGEGIAVEISPIEVICEDGQSDLGGTQMAEGQQGSEESRTDMPEGMETQTRESIPKLRRKVEQYYGLESNKVKIEYKGR